MNLPIYNKTGRMSFEEVTNINFKLPEARTWGLEKSKFNKGKEFSLPLILDADTAAAISKLAKENNAKSPIYGATKKHSGTLYLKLKNISEKQRTELFDKGKESILVHFSLTGTYEDKNEVKHLVFKTTRLRKNFSEEEEAPED